MSAYPLEGRCILIVEDEYLLAEDMCDALLQAGAEILGPAPDPSTARSLIEAQQRIDGALLDINLRGEMVFEVADLLVARGVPFVFATGYDQWAVPERFTAVPRLEKPVKAQHVASVLEPMMV